MTTALEELDSRARRIETRLTRMMLAMGVDPGKSYDRNAVAIDVDKQYGEINIPTLEVTMLDMSNAITSEGGNLREGWTIIMNGRVMGTLMFAM
jgi:hypothetical protein